MFQQELETLVKKEETCWVLNKKSWKKKEKNCRWESSGGVWRRFNLFYLRSPETDELLRSPSIAEKFSNLAGRVTQVVLKQHEFDYQKKSKICALFGFFQKSRSLENQNIQNCFLLFSTKLKKMVEILFGEVESLTSEIRIRTTSCVKNSSIFAVLL